MIVRLCKAALVASVAAFFALVGFDNITDHATNYVFVERVLAMDTIFPDAGVRWRAVADPVLVWGAYGLIIVWQVTAAVILFYATTRLVLTAGNGRAFRAAKVPAVLGLTMGLMLYGFGFTVVGGEWFAMWQSKTWNGLDSSARFILFSGVTLLVLLSGEPDEA